MSPFWEDGLAISLEGEPSRPGRFYWQWRWHQVDDVLYHWRVHTGWWTDGEIWRDYWEVITETGLLCVLYQDMVERTWYLERIYE